VKREAFPVVSTGLFLSGITEDSLEDL